MDTFHDCTVCLFYLASVRPIFAIAHDAAFLPFPMRTCAMLVCCGGCDRRPSNKNAERSLMERVMSELQNHPQAWPFQQPVNKKEVPDYYDVIQDPMGA